VGLLNALYAFNGQMVSALQLAKEAIYVEQNLIGEKVGVQDQCAAAVGGLNYFEFKQDGSITYKPVIISRERKSDFKNHMLLFYTGIQRFAEDVLKEQIDKTKSGQVTQDLSQIRNMVDEGFNILTTNKDLSEFGLLLHKAWMLKKNLSSSISNNYLDEMYDKAMQAGALGGKLLGAGGGGFFLFFAKPESHNSIRKALHQYQEIDFDFDNDGSKIIFVH
jgi:D-glycero-alpha-D-manno-heptose-7-phosphate kinase